MKIIDTHAHVDQLEDLNGAMERAKEAGVTDIVAVSVDYTSMQRILAIAAQFQEPKVHPALGIHPGKVNEPDHAQALAYLNAHITSAMAVGETGLDYWYKWVRKDEEERGRQKESFQRHLDIAKIHGLPIIIHSRGAWRDCLEMTLAAKVTRVLFHWYSGPVDILQKIVASGFYVSTSPSLAYSPESRLAMAQAPMERILIETDAPVHYKDEEGSFLAEPRDVTRTLKALAKLKELDEDNVLAAVNQNARDFFRI